MSERSPTRKGSPTKKARRALAAAASAATLLGLAGMASAAPPPPIDLRVAGGEEAWRPTRAFRLLWSNPAVGGGPAIVAVRYRVHSPDGAVAIGTARRDGPFTSIEGLNVPGVPGAYTARVWLEDAAGGEGPAASAKLRFDDGRPGPVEAIAAPAWIGRTSFPLAVRLGRPSGELPVSGIRGYAVSVSRAPGGSPCAAVDRCAEAEIDLRGGAGDNSYSIADLPEGVNHLQAVAVSGAGMTSPQPQRVILRVDETSPVTRLEGAPSGWTNRAVRLTATATDSGSGMVPTGEGTPPYTAIAIDGAPPAISPGATVSATVIEEGVHRVAHYARDLAGNVDDGGASNGTPNPPPATALVRIDRRAPHVSFANSQDPADPDLVRARIADSTSGPDPDRGWIGVRRAGSHDRFEALPAAPSSPAELSGRWDSDAHPPGEYEFRAVGYDAAGNATVTTRRANGGPMLLTNPLKAGTALRFSFRRGVLRRAVPYGRGPLLHGGLTTGRNWPLARAPVRIVERFPGAATAVRVSTVATGPDGRFALRLSPGPSREIAAFFDGSPTLGRSSSRPLRLAVRSGVRLRLSSARARIGGPPLVFRGKVAAAAGTIPAGGKSVQLQFRLPGRPWSEFRTVQSDERGRFRYAYRFSDDDSRGARFQFRAYATAQSGWPYEPAGSLPVAVKGT